MKIGNLIDAVRAFLGKLTDALIKGRELGWWDRGVINTPEEYEKASRYFEEKVHQLPDYEQAKLHNMLWEYEQRNKLY